MSDLFTPVTLASGARLSNRIAKAAMEENLAGPGQVPDERLWRLFETWGKGGAALLVTGNVMIDGRAMTGPGGVVLESTTSIAPFQRWAHAAKGAGAQIWMQISHPGRQVFAGEGSHAWAPSAVPLEMGNLSKLFEPPIAMTEAQIHEIIERFAQTAAAAERAGFDGVELHGAHGYLISQFLSPLANRRDDAWGGDLERRARLLREVVRAVRASVSPSFTVAVKLNSSDFQRGGFDDADAGAVIAMLGRLSVDLVELSGGNYESPAMQGTAAAPTQREAYFLDLATRFASGTAIPLMVTGGIRSRATAERAIASGPAMIGLATALALTPDLPNRWKNADVAAPSTPRSVLLKKSALSAVATMAHTRAQLLRVAQGRDTQPSASPTLALVKNRLERRRQTKRYKEWLSKRDAAPAQVSDRGYAPTA